MRVTGSSLLGPLAALLLAQTAAAYETDQFTGRLEPLEDSTEVLNARVNEAIAQVASDWRWGRDEPRFGYRVYRIVGGHHWVDKLERWAMDAEAVDRIEIPSDQSIYAGHPIWATRVAFLFGIGATIKVAGQHIGTDKIGHFFSQGLKFYRRYLRLGDEARAAERSAYTERALFGQKTTGSYSNADLVANYEGYRFYRSLFDDDVVPGKPAILRWTGEGFAVQRAFDWADHVNPYWDEALNINHYDGLLRPHMVERLKGFCGDFHRQPTRYRIDDEAALLRRYRHLQLRPTADLRLEQLCESRVAEGPAAEPTTAGPGCAPAPENDEAICGN